MTRRRVVVVGGGIAGLAAAHRLVEQARAGAALDVVLLDTAERLGGSVGTERSGGFVLEQGADSLITDKPWGLALCERVGIADRLVGTREGERRTYVVRDGRLLPLPEGFLLMAPTSPWPVATSPLFSVGGKLRMALDLVLPRRSGGGDESLAAFVRRRLGEEALARVADPLVGGIYTADPERLSLAATMPRFLELERTHRSVILGLRATTRVPRGSAGARYGMFVAPADGMGALVDAVARRLPEGVVRSGTAVESLAHDGERWLVGAGGRTFDADAVVVATPAFAAARLVAPLDASLARALDAIEYASSATVTLGFRAADVADRLVGSASSCRSLSGGRCSPALSPAASTRAARRRVTSWCAPSWGAHAGLSWSSWTTTRWWRPCAPSCARCSALPPSLCWSASLATGGGCRSTRWGTSIARGGDRAARGGVARARAGGRGLPRRRHSRLRAQRRGGGRRGGHGGAVNQRGRVLCNATSCGAAHCRSGNPSQRPRWRDDRQRWPRLGPRCAPSCYRGSTSRGPRQGRVLHDVVRFNDVYDEPRDVLTASGAKVEEVPHRHHNFGRCCGAGGGRMWIEEPADKRVNLLPTDEACRPIPRSSGCRAPCRPLSARTRVGGLSRALLAQQRSHALATTTDASNSPST